MSRAAQLLAAALAAAFLAGCGGKDDRLKSHLEKGKALLAKGELDRAGVEVRNVLQIDPTSSEGYLLNAQIWERRADPRKAFASYAKTVELAPDNLVAKASLSRFYLFGGDTEKAEKTIAEVLAVDPESAVARTVQAALTARKGDAEAAIREAGEVLRKNPGSKESATLLASLQMAKGDKAAARKVLEQAVAANPEEVDLRVILAGVLELSGDLPAANEQQAALVKLQPKNLRYRSGHAAGLVRAGKIDAAEAVLRDAIKADPADDERYLLLTGFLVQRRSPEAAEKALAGFVTERPKAYRLRFAQAELLLGARRNDEAMKVLQAIVDLDKTGPSALQARNSIARLHYAEGRVDAGDKLVAEVIIANPRDNAALLMRAERASAKQAFGDAIVDLRSVLKDQPDSVQLVVALSRAHMANKEPELARETLQRAVQLFPRRPELRLALAGFLVSQNDGAAALRELDEMIGADPKNVQAKLQGLQAKAELHARNKDWKAAEASLRQMIEVEPAAAIGHVRLAQLALAQSKPEAAVADFDRALAKAPGDLEILSNVSRVLLGMKKPDEALKRVSAAATALPERADLQVALGELLASQKRFDQAEPAFAKAISLNPRITPAYTNLAQLHLARGKPADAERVLKEGLAVEPRNAALDLAYAELLQRLERMDDALARYEIILKYAPGNDIAANNLASLLTDFRTDKASFDRALQLARRFETATNPLYLDTLGWAYYRAGDPAKAVEVLERAFKAAENIPVIRYHLGMALVKAGRTDAGREQLQKAVDTATTTFPGIEEAKRVLGKG